MYKKRPNHLATLIERQAAAKAALPDSITNKLQRLFNYTTELKLLLADSLPQEIVNTLLVVSYDNKELTLAVTSQTAANHLTYLKQPLKQLIATQSLTLNQLNNIKVIVTYNLKDTDLSSLNCANSYHHSDDRTNRTPSKSMVNASRGHIQKELTPKTKETIAYVVEHVISDTMLKKALKKLME